MPGTSHRILWQVLRGFYNILFGRRPVALHNVLSAAFFGYMTNYFVNDGWYVVPIDCVISLSQRQILCCMTAIIIGVMVFLKARYSSCTANTDGVIDNVLKKCQIVVSYRNEPV